MDFSSFIKLRYPETAEYFSPYCVDDSGEYDLYVTEEDIHLHGDPVGSLDPSAQEYSLLVASASRFLLRRDRVVYHAAALRLFGSAWLITGPSGVGKSTQYSFLKRLYGDEVGLICGDKPILQRCGDGSVFVHPSPWPGKERFPCGEGGGLRGIVILEQAMYDEISPLEVRKALFPVFREFLYSPECEDEARAAGSIAEAMLGSAPVWKLRNLGDEASARLLYETLKQYCGNKHEDL